MAARRKLLAGLGALAALLGLLVALLWAGVIAADRTEERADLDLRLDASAAGWAQVTRQFFDVPEVAAATVGALAPEMDSADQLVALLAESIRRSPALDAAFVGYPDGSFLFVGRSEEGGVGGFRTRRISIDEGERLVELSWTDADLDPVRTTEDDSDDYDPRDRLWYVPIAAGADENWTAPYLFSSSQQPGITHSIAVRDDAGDLQAVVGIDIRLDDFNRFLEQLRPGDNGAAFVVDVRGRVIAASSADPLASVPSGAEGLLTLEGSPELQGLVEVSIANPTRTVRARSVDGTKTTIVRPASASAEWYLAVQARDSDFLSPASTGDAFEIFAVGLTSAALVAGIGWLVLRYVLGLRRQAEFDELTGLLNRRGVTRRLGAATGSGSSPMHLAIIDLDGFKPINDTYGHPAGDVTLQVTAKRLSNFARRHSMTAGRLGGDEFVIFGSDEPPPWEQLTAALAEPIDYEDLTLRVTASIGVADVASAGGSIEDLLSSADHLLFEAKRSGGNAYRRTEVAPSNR